jgi:hypothetical protein
MRLATTRSRSLAESVVRFWHHGGRRAKAYSLGLCLVLRARRP